VKVVTDADGKALYFSRATIPFDRDGTSPLLQASGLLSYRKAALDRFVDGRSRRWNAQSVWTAYVFLRTGIQSMSRKRLLTRSA